MEFNFKKKYGQNFISDKNLLRAIVVDAKIKSDDCVLEIGAGMGSLTQILAENCKKLISYEIDLELRSYLEQIQANNQNLTLCFKDIMQESTSEIDKKFGCPYKIVANLPYYITTPIIFKFLEESTQLTSMAIMVQREVAEKIISSPKSENYGILSVMANYYCDCSIARIVKKQNFHPMPKIDSAIIVLERKRDVSFDKSFTNFVKSSFAMRRKTLYNNLQSYYEKESILNALAILNFKQSVRAEELTVLDFEKLYNSLKKDKFRQN